MRGSGPDETDELDNEAILSEHIDRTLNSGHRTPNQAGLTAIVSKKHSNVQDNQQFIGSLPIYRDVSSDADSKVKTTKIFLSFYDVIMTLQQYFFGIFIENSTISRFLRVIKL